MSGEIKAKKKIGAPTIYTEELADRICELVATHTLGTNQLCKQHDWMPSEDTIYKWRYRHSSFAEKYALAKSKQAELMVEQIIDISDDKSDDLLYDELGNKKLDPGAIAHRRLQVDTRKWYASKLAPKIYGDRSNANDDNKPNNEDVKKAIEILNKCVLPIP